MSNLKYPVKFDYSERLVFTILYYNNQKEQYVQETALCTLFVHSPTEKSYWIETISNLYHGKKRCYSGCEYTLYIKYKSFDCSFHNVNK